MKLVTVLLLFVGAMSAGASTHGDLVIFRSVDVGRTLPGSAYLMSVGPGLEADVPMKIDGLESTGTVKGHRFLRVTLFRVERSYSIWVEEIFINRAGGTRVEKCSSFSMRVLVEKHPWVGPLEPESVSWIDANTFELLDDSAWDDPEDFVPMNEPRRVRFRLVESGAFEISNGAEN